jgi:hypothetical protein
MGSNPASGFGFNCPSGRVPIIQAIYKGLCCIPLKKVPSRVVLLHDLVPHRTSNEGGYIYAYAAKIVVGEARGASLHLGTMDPLRKFKMDSSCGKGIHEVASEKCN